MCCVTVLCVTPLCVSSKINILRDAEAVPAQEDKAKGTPTQDCEYNFGTSKVHMGLGQAKQVLLSRKDLGL